MCIVHSSRISKTFNEATLREAVEIVGCRADTLLEIVNYNVDMRHIPRRILTLADFGFSGFAICRGRRSFGFADPHKRS
jgi:hypothetical protein